MINSGVHCVRLSEFQRIYTHNLGSTPVDSGGLVPIMCLLLPPYPTLTPLLGNVKPLFHLHHGGCEGSSILYEQTQSKSEEQDYIGNYEMNISVFEHHCRRKIADGQHIE